jgi:hypothetical protein
LVKTTLNTSYKNIGTPANRGKLIQIRGDNASSRSIRNTDISLKTENRQMIKELKAIGATKTSDFNQQFDKLYNIIPNNEENDEKSKDSNRAPLKSLKIPNNDPRPIQNVKKEESIVT